MGVEMKYITLAAVTALTLGVAVTAQAGNDPSFNGATWSRTKSNSSASLNALLAEWDQASFNAPGKPGQPRVYGREGYVTTGGEYNVMVALIRSAVDDVRVGHDQDAAPKIAKARDLLAASNLRKG
jgi:hypothetical protein